MVSKNRNKKRSAAVVLIIVEEAVEGQKVREYVIDHTHTHQHNLHRIHMVHINIILLHLPTYPSTYFT